MKRSRFMLTACGLVMLAAIGLGLFFMFRPKPVWIVADRYLETWNKVLAASAPPLRKAKIIPRSNADAALPRSWYGYRIDSLPTPRAREADSSPVTVYRRLAQERRYGQALPLVVDPWLVFRKFTTPSLSREAAEKGAGGNGQILLAGSDSREIWAWAAQLAQDPPGIFPPNGTIWDQNRETIPLSRNFQQGAMTYSWQELWPPLLDDDKTVWVYAPLSRIRELPVYQTNILEADVFPIRPGWNEFGIQAEILWAIPYGSDRNRQKLSAAEDWLKSADFQSLIADTMGWLAVHPQAPPYNPVSGDARLAWLTSSYVWTITAGE